MRRDHLHGARALHAYNLQASEEADGELPQYSGENGEIYSTYESDAHPVKEINKVP